MPPAQPIKLNTPTHVAWNCFGLESVKIEYLDESSNSWILLKDSIRNSITGFNRTMITLPASITSNPVAIKTSSLDNAHFAVMPYTIYNAVPQIGLGNTITGCTVYPNPSKGYVFIGFKSTKQYKGLFIRWEAPCKQGSFM